MSQRAIIDAVAAEHGWRIHSEPEKPEWMGVTEYRKRNGRKVAYLRVNFGAVNQVTDASWADNLQGWHGRAISNSHSGKRDWVLARLRGES